MATLAVFYPMLFDRLLRLRVLWAACIAAGCLFLSHFPKSSPLGCTLGFTIAYLTSAACLLGLYKTGVEKALPWICRPVALAGVYSYAIYIWHVPAEKLLDHFVLKGQLGNSVAVVFANYAVAILAGYMMTRLLERPFLALREFMFPR